MLKSRSCPENERQTLREVCEPLKMKGNPRQAALKAAKDAARSVCARWSPRFVPSLAKRRMPRRGTVRGKETLNINKLRKFLKNSLLLINLQEVGGVSVL